MIAALWIAGILAGLLLGQGNNDGLIGVGAVVYLAGMAGCALAAVWGVLALIHRWR